MSEPVKMPLGLTVNDHGAHMLGVIGRIEQSGTGNTVFHVGNHISGEDGWVKAAHVVLVPTEREALIEALIDQRETDGGEAAHNTKPRLIVNAGEIRDLWQHMREDIPFKMRLTDGTEIEVSAGDPVTGEIGNHLANLDEIRVLGTSL